MDVHLGMMTIGTNLQQPMSYFIMPGTTPNARMFTSAGNVRYEWRKLNDRLDSYDLYSSPNTVIATFRRETEETPVGVAHAAMQYNFDNDTLLLESLVALCLNRWMALRRS
ncbi:hypothetical protein AcW2_004179 [Taiwanofungus camphoratus]|nr:hypothetical protein AcW2_004179 [Antrodia cinnamomea]